MLKVHCTDHHIETMVGLHVDNFSSHFSLKEDRADVLTRMEAQQCSTGNEVRGGELMMNEIQENNS